MTRIRVLLEVEYTIATGHTKDEQVALWSRHCQSINQFRTPGLVKGSASCALVSVDELVEV